MNRATVQTIKRRLENRLGLGADKTSNIDLRETELKLRLRRHEAFDLLELLRAVHEQKASVRGVDQSRLA